ncbi:hypothetical protein GW17_00044782 [Ensete ventricosum]|nr:hypothetical protein GW17_00044782 [Ensete ventricosum]
MFLLRYQWRKLGKLLLCLSKLCMFELLILTEIYCQSTEQNSDWAGDDIDEDAFEALFSQLEEDLKNDNLLSDDVDDDISEEDLARLEQELEEALGVGDNDDISGISPSSGHLGSDEDDEYEDRRPKLKNWQMRRLAHALKIGRRKTSVSILL